MKLVLCGFNLLWVQLFSPLKSTQNLYTGSFIAAIFVKEKFKNNNTFEKRNRKLTGRLA